MNFRQARVDAYNQTISRLEPDIHAIDDGFANASIAISLKRIADSLEELHKLAARDYATYHKEHDAKGE